MRTHATALRLLLALSLLTGIGYPLLILLAAQAAFPSAANGSLLTAAGGPGPGASAGPRVIGSRLLGQPFASARYFQGRPSATAPLPYNGLASSGSNLGPNNPALLEEAARRVAALRRANPGGGGTVPADLVTASGSGLDPHMSLAAALFQVDRVAAARGMKRDDLVGLVQERVEGGGYGLSGEPRVNVLELNLALDRTGGP